MFHHTSTVYAPSGIFYDVAHDQINNITNHFLNSPDSEFASLREASASGAAYNSSERQSRCLESTRQDIMTKLSDWVSNPDGHSVCCLYGLVGSGKSAIAQSFAELLERKNWPIVSFFFSQVVNGCNNSQRLFLTIAHQLAVNIPVLRSPIRKVLHENPTIAYQSLRFQFRKLILDPISHLEDPLTSPVIVIIDSLHECGKEAIEVLSCIGEVLSECRLHIRFFFASRFDPHIQTAFQIIRQHALFISLHDFDDNDDIRLFLRSQFCQIQPYSSLHSTWLSDEDFEALVEATSGLFVYASLIAEFIMKGTGHPRQQLMVALDGKRDSMASIYANIDALYLQILSAMSPSFDVDPVKLIVGAVALLFDPLPLKDLDNLLQLESGIAFWAVQGLQSILLIPDLDGGDGSKPTRLIHTQFRYFLADKERSHIYFIDPPLHHASIAHFCLDLMSKMLKKMGTTERYSKDNRERTDRHSRRKCIEGTGEAFRYACHHWDLHLAETLPHVSLGLVSDLGIFAPSLFLWIEIMDLWGDMGTAVPAIQVALEWLKAAPYSATLVQQFHDAKQFVKRFERNAQTCEFCHHRPKYANGYRIDPYCSTTCAVEAIPRDDTFCLCCRQKNKLQNLDYCGWECAAHAEKESPMVLEVSGDDAVFKKAAEYFEKTWDHASRPAPSVRKVYKIVLTPNLKAAFENYRDRMETQGNFVAEGLLAGNETLLWHSPQRLCKVGDSSHTQLCSSSDCGLCVAIHTAFGLPNLASFHFSTSPTPDFTCSSRSQDSWVPILLNDVVLGKASFTTSKVSGYDSGRGGLQIDNSYYPFSVVFDNGAVRPSSLLMLQG